MTTRYVKIRQMRKDLSQDARRLFSVIKQVKGVGNLDLILDYHDEELKEVMSFRVNGENYNFMDVLNVINRRGYAVLEDKIVRGEQK